MIKTLTAQKLGKATLALRELDRAFRACPERADAAARGRDRLADQQGARRSPRSRGCVERLVNHTILVPDLEHGAANLPAARLGDRHARRRSAHRATAFCIGGVAERGGEFHARAEEPDARARSRGGADPRSRCEEVDAAAPGTGRARSKPRRRGSTKRARKSRTPRCRSPRCAASSRMIEREAQRDRAQAAEPRRRTRQQRGAASRGGGAQWPRSKRRSPPAVQQLEALAGAPRRGAERTRSPARAGKRTRRRS